ncbi:MAG: hypothetical protein M5U01_08310 [Ardenticatenaceae bacterium]|nr:hypothetical protein [Ardenticatenaceae bacterium]
MSTLYVEPRQKASEVLPLVRSAIEGEVVRLELAMKLARERLAPFEQKYGVTSEHFMSELAAEDLEGGDEEYVHWAGEYKLMQRLQEKLHQLREIEFGDSSLLQPDQSDG